MAGIRDCVRARESEKMAGIRVNSDTLTSVCCWARAAAAAGARSSSPSRAAQYLITNASSSLPHPAGCCLSPDASTREAAPLILRSSSPPPPLINPRRSSTSIMRLPTAADLAGLTTPSLHCTFPALVHADYEAVKEQCDAWIEAVAAPPSASSARFLHDCLLPLLVCRSIPHAVSRQRLLHVIKVVAWLMIADDDDDQPDLLGSDYSATSHRADLVMAMLRGSDELDINSFDCESVMASARPGIASRSARMLKALAELWLEIRQDMAPSLKARFISTMADYLEGVKVQASIRKEDIMPNMKSYMEIRRQASFLIPCFILMEYALDIDLEKVMLHSPIMQELHDVALDYINLCNDIVSCRAEIHMGDYFNLPCILYNSIAFWWSFMPFQYAMNHVGQMAQDLNQRAIILISTIHEESKQFEPYMVPIINAYVDGLSQCMSGTLAWFFETARYQQVNVRREFHKLS